MNTTELVQEQKKQLIETILSSTDTIPAIRKMQQLDNLIKAHGYDIYQAKDGRWVTYIKDITKKDGRRKIAKKSKEAMIEFLTDYYGGQAGVAHLTLEKVYPVWLGKYKAADRASGSLKRWDSDWKKFYKDEPLSQELIKTPMEEITRLQIKTWTCAVIKKYNLTKKAWRGMMSIIIDCFDYLIQDEKLTDNPARRLRIGKAIFQTPAPKAEDEEAFNDQEIKAILAESWHRYKDSHDEMWLAIPLLYHTGLRLGEVEGLMFGDFDERNHQLSVQRSLKAVDEMDADGNFGKRRYELQSSLKQGQPGRVILIGDAAFEIKKEVERNLMATGRRRQKLLFQVKTHGNIEARLKRICKALGIKHRSPHKLRKTYVSKLIRETNDIAFAQHQVGHKDAKTTLTCYVRQTETDAAKVAILNALG